MRTTLRSILFWILILANLGCNSPDSAVKAYLDNVIDINNSISSSIETSGAASRKRMAENKEKSAELQAKALTADRDQWTQDKADLKANKILAEKLEVPATGEDLQSKFLAFLEEYDRRLQSRIKVAEAQLKDGQPPSPEALGKIHEENKALLEKYNAFNTALRELGESSGIRVN